MVRNKKFSSKQKSMCHKSKSGRCTVLTLWMISCMVLKVFEKHCDSIWA